MAISHRAMRKGYQPLRITARLRCGVISDGLLPIDAVLYFAAHRQARPGQRIAARPRERAVDDDETVGMLPLMVHGGQTPHWFYAASCAQWRQPYADGIDHWTKRVDARYADLVTTSARVPISGGRYRAYHMPVHYRHALAVDWYVVGQIDQVRALLGLVSHIGKKTEMGWGAVIDWRVEPTPEDWSITGPDGRLMRPVPAAEGTLYGLRPPYWLPRNQACCRLPQRTA